MQGSSSGRSGDGTGSPRPLGRYDELNRAHERAETERTDRKLTRLERGDPTHPARTPAAADPATLTGNEWSARARSMVDELHGRVFGRYAPSPAGDQIISGLGAGHHRPDSSATMGKSGAGKVPGLAVEDKMRVDIATLEEKPYAWLAVAGQAPAPREPATPTARTTVDQVYERMGRNDYRSAATEVTRIETGSPARRTGEVLPADRLTDSRRETRHAASAEPVSPGKDTGIDPER